MSSRTYIGSVRVALLDDHALVLKGLVAHLKTYPSLVVVGSSPNSQQFRTLLAHMPADVALIDYSLSPDDPDGLSLVRSLRAAFPRMKLVVVSAYEDGPLVRRVLGAGAHGFVFKSQDPDEVVRAIDAAMTGRTYVPPGLQGALEAGDEPKLSPRENEVIRCLLDGMTVTQIATKFGRSLKTISAQKSSAYRKLGIDNDVQLFSMREHVIATGGGQE
ncbi:response regulator transcription factor [Luteibacter aegosomatissinici]|uniref:response regulator transcription factor n=1 Tax=Luteibacter aegosomatissinici TaxID=2911539 RepID=UPI001FFBE817|nr:response regulator transcription factor [Luteibacter aegosomatissinici]UPG96441.1 response regulator transcription factor [Luteibacter aegosomatissinici]